MPRSSRLILAASPLALLIHLSAAALADETPTIALDEVTVTARGRAASLSETPGGVGVATSDDIEASARKDSVADVLANIPGVAVSGDSPWGRDIAIRGLSGTSVVILIDGKRINTATDLNARLGIINPMDVERVEVLKGPISALYGSGSTGGVVNIITRKGAFSGEEGFHGRQAITATTNGAGADGLSSIWYNSKDLWLLGSGAFRAHEDVTGGADTDVANSGYKDAQFRLAGGVKAGDLTLELSALRSQAWDVGIPGGSTALPTNGKVGYPRTTNTLLGADATWDVNGDVLKDVQANLYYNRIERRVSVTNTGVATVAEIRPAADHETVGGGLRSNLEFGSHAVVAGFDAWSWEMTSSRQRLLTNGRVSVDQPTPRARQTSMGVFTEDTVKLAPDWTLNLGGRVDQVFTHNDAMTTTPYFAAGDHTDTGWNGHVGVTWDMGDGWSQSVLAGASYRAADILERFKYISLSGGVTLWGNPDLKPETTLFAEWGLGCSSPVVRGDLRVFANKIHDYITRKSVSSTRQETTNIGEARIVGVEFEGRWNLSKSWNLHGDVTAADGRDETKDEALRFVAPVSGKVGVGYEADGWFATLDERWALAKDDDVSGARAVDGYATTHLSGGYAFTGGKTKHKVTLALDNLFDTKYRSWLANARGMDLVEPGFAATLSYSMEF